LDRNTLYKLEWSAMTGYSSNFISPIHATVKNKLWVTSTVSTVRGKWIESSCSKLSEVRKFIYIHIRKFIYYVGTYIGSRCPKCSKLSEVRKVISNHKRKFVYYVGTYGSRCPKCSKLSEVRNIIYIHKCQFIYYVRIIRMYNPYTEIHKLLF
jgi:hypothetical protein